MKIHLSHPVAPWNPQRGDQVTPRLKLKDNQQCMGNVFQDFFVYVGMLKNIPDFANLTTYNYYALLEDWIIRHKGNVYDSANHAEHFNELMCANNVALRVVKKPGNKDELCHYFENGPYPCGLGTKLTHKGHIIRGLGILEFSDGKRMLEASDPFGFGPRYLEPNGHKIHYDLDWLFELGVPTILYLEDVKG
ncbi:hypothetical protein [Leptospira santarosai]|uniref:Uncharacterized protein n=1 Tax=Leptospira santarosai serovar Shermani str. LT 821 TaxID=758847 RepID=K8Y568_9LEPT|nr:hypothetical protein [Leptospira santarosai]EKT88091.1 hypothetical protein LSS_03864 [Leptospira santarosai serovar Shermani str. LT 821]EPG81852.1 hypothetical protein LEP1GSC048_2681 [Leptospira santarosai serovar Shermani str. 1342KT]